MRPLRTALFAPGNRPDRVEKALGLGADAVHLGIFEQPAENDLFSERIGL